MMEDEIQGKRGGGEQESVREALGRLDATEVTRAVSAFARENPHVALAAAAGLGFLLGGGLTPRMLGTLGFLATRSYLRGAVAQALQGLVSEQPQSQLGSSS